MGEGALTRDAAITAPQPLLRLLSDDRLTRMAAAGSAPAFATIYQRHHQDVYRYCRSILRDEHDARDALQNTMIKALSALEGETREIAVRPWLFRIAHNESVSLLRRRSPDVSIDQVADLPSVGDDGESRQRLHALIADLELLTERQRSALVMRELSGLEFAEIAAALDTSADGAKQAVYEARMALRDLEQSRGVGCGEIRQLISAEDRRRLRARGVRAHMKTCSDCREFADQIRSRSGQLAALAPPLPAPIALGILEGIIGGGGGGGAAVAAATGGGGAALAGTGGGVAIKLGVAAIAVVGVGGVAMEARTSGDGTDSRPAVVAAGPADEIGGKAAAGGAGSSRSSSASADSGGRSGDPAAGGADENRAGSGSSESESEADGGRASGESTTPGTDAPGQAPGAQAPAPDTPASTPVDDGAPSGTPPGQGGTPPGQGGTPPGLSSPPPGQGGTPPALGGSVPPGHGGTPPGQAATPPGQGGTPPGLSSPPPGHGGTPPGHGGTPPGQGNGPKS